jgi:hypothetical protein
VNFTDGGLNSSYYSRVDLARSSSRCVRINLERAWLVWQDGAGARQVEGLRPGVRADTHRPLRPSLHTRAGVPGVGVGVGAGGARGHGESSLSSGRPHETSRTSAWRALARRTHGRVRGVSLVASARSRCELARRRDACALLKGGAVPARLLPQYVSPLPEAGGAGLGIDLTDACIHRVIWV